MRDDGLLELATSSD